MIAAYGVAVLIATQNLNAVLRILQWGVIALIFLFFLRVIRSEFTKVPFVEPRSSIQSWSLRRKRRAWSVEV